MSEVSHSRTIARITRPLRTEPSGAATRWFRALGVAVVCLAMTFTGVESALAVDDEVGIGITAEPPAAEAQADETPGTEAPPADPAEGETGETPPADDSAEAPSEEPTAPPEEPAEEPTEDPTEEPVEGSVAEDELALQQNAELEITPFDAGPDGATPPYVYWTVEDGAGALVGGATFQLQGPRTSSRFGTNVTWNNNSTTVPDCTSAPCSGPDLDPDEGEFLVKTIGSHNISDSNRYRVRQVTPPTNYAFVDSNQWVHGSGNGNTPSGWSGRTYDFGEFEVRAYATLSCAAGYFYSIATDGVVRQIDASGNVTQVTDSSWDGSSANGLAIGAHGSVMYGYNRSGRISTDVAEILRYTEAGGWEELPNTAYDTGGNRSLVTGAVDLSTGKYLFGGYHDSGSDLYFRLYEFDPAKYPTPGGTAAFRFLGQFDTDEAAGSAANGDMGFDAAGNLYIVRSGDTTNIYTVTAATLAGANGGTLAFGKTDEIGSSVLGLSDINGIAFASDGRVYLGNGSSYGLFDPSTWERVGGVKSGLTNSTDLASCSSPATLTLQKDVKGRVAADDQFTLTISRNTTTVSTATTAGEETGIQEQQVGPVPVTTGSNYTISESMATGSTSPMTKYTSSWVCTDSGGSVIASGNGTTGNVTVPNVPEESVKCVFTNSPLTSQVRVTKMLTDGSGADPIPEPDWGVEAIATREGSTGTVTQSPTATEAQTGDDGSAYWTLTYDAADTRASVEVSEEQRTGFEFIEGSCLITLLDGSSSEVTMTGPDGFTVEGVAPGSTVHCAFVNQPTISVEVTKRWEIRDSGGNVIGTYHQPAQPGDTSATLPSGFSATPTLTDPSGTVVDAAWGTAIPGYLAGAEVTANERAVTVPAGCEVTGSKATAFNGTTLPAPATLPYTATLTGTPNPNSVQITNSVTCSQELTLVKEVAFGSTAATAWTLTATGPTGALPGPSGTTGSDEATAPVTALAAYALSESGGPTTYVPDEDWACVADGGGTLPLEEGSVQLGYGQSATCTIVNTTAKMTLLKRVGDWAAPAEWTLHADPAANDFEFEELETPGAASPSATNTWEVRPGQGYALTETVSDGGSLAYVLDRVEVCIHSTAQDCLEDGATWQTVADPASVQVAAGEHAIFRFVNERQPGFPLPLTGGLASDMFLIGGGLTALVAAGAAVWFWRRKRLGLAG